MIGYLLFLFYSSRVFGLFHVFYEIFQRDIQTDEEGRGGQGANYWTETGTLADISTFPGNHDGMVGCLSLLNINCIQPTSKNLFYLSAFPSKSYLTERNIGFQSFLKASTFPRNHDGMVEHQW